MVETGCSAGLCSLGAALKAYPSVPVGSVWKEAVPEQNSFACSTLHCSWKKGRLELQVSSKIANAAGGACPKTAHDLAWLFSKGKGINRICYFPAKRLLSSIKHGQQMAVHLLPSMQSSSEWNSPWRRGHLPPGTICLWGSLWTKSVLAYY